MAKPTWGVALAMLALPLSAADNKPILIGEISSYSTVPAFTVPYRNGWQLAVEEINAAGGLLGGRRLEVISRDDGGKPDDATRSANELLSQPEGGPAGRHVPLQCGPGGERHRAAQQGAVRGGRAAHRCPGVGQGQPLHLPPAAQHLHAGGDAGGRGGQAPGQDAGRRWRPTTSTVSRRWPTSRSC